MSDSVSLVFLCFTAEARMFRYIFGTCLESEFGLVFRYAPKPVTFSIS